MENSSIEMRTIETNQEHLLQIEGGSDYLILEKKEIEKKEALIKIHKITFMTIAALSGVGAICLSFNSEKKFEKGLLTGICFSSLLAHCTYRQYHENNS